jgi:hypothetical protein
VQELSHAVFGLANIWQVCPAPGVEFTNPRGDGQSFTFILADNELIWQQLNAYPKIII